MSIFATALLSSALLMSGSPAADEPADLEPVILDEEQVFSDNLDEQAANADELDDVRFVVWSVEDDSITENNYDRDVREHLDTLDEPDVAEGTSLQDEVALITLSPELRQLGVYAGDDVDISNRVVQDAVDDMRPHAADAEWDDAMVAGVESVSDSLGESDEGSAGGYDFEAPSWFAPMMGFLIIGVALGVPAVVTVRVVKNWLDRRQENARLVREVPQHLDSWHREWRRIRDRSLEHDYEQGSRRAADLLKKIEAAQRDPSNLDLLRAAERAGFDNNFPQGASNYSIKSRLDYLDKTPGWEEKWDRFLDSKLGEKINKAEASADDLREYARDRDHQRAMRAVAKARERMADIDSKVKSDVWGVEEAESAVDDAVEALKSSVKRVAKKSKMVEEPPVRFRRNQDDLSFVSVASVAWLGLYVASTTSAASSTSSTGGSTGMVGTPVSTVSMGGFSGGSGGF